MTGLRPEDVTEGVPVRVLVEGTAVAVVRIGDELLAIRDLCSHADVALSEGTVWCEERQIECVRHGSVFSLDTGRPESLPATQPVPVYPVSVVEGRVVVDVTGGER